MGSDVSKYVPLKRIVSYFLDEHDKSIGEFDKAWVLAFRALVDCGFDVSFEPLSVRLPVLANKTVPLPSDYLSWSKIGILNNQGEVSSLKVNNGLSTFRDNNPNRLTDIVGNIDSSLPALWGSPFFFNYLNNGWYNNLFGVGGGLIQYGQCKIDEKNMVILLPDDFQYADIILEYLSSPEKNDDYQVQIVMQEAIIAFIAWKMKLGPEQSYYDRKKEGRRRLPGKKITLQEINEVIRLSTGQYLKA